MSVVSRAIAGGVAYLSIIFALSALACKAIYAVADAIGRHAAQAPVVAKSSKTEPVVVHRVLQEDWFRSLGSSRSSSRSNNSAPPDRFDRSQRSNLTRPAEPPPFTLFGNWGDNRRDWRDFYEPLPRQVSNTYRTVCVRLCDGFYYPVSFSATRDRFARDEAACQASCGSDAKLYVYRNPGEDPDQMVDLRGQPYAKLRTAFLYRTTYNENCKCRPHAWEQVSLDRHRLYALEARRQKGDRTVQQEIDQIRQRQRQSALEQRTPNKVVESRRAATTERLAVAAPGGPVASDVAASLSPGAAPSPDPRPIPIPRGGEFRPNVASAAIGPLDSAPPISDGSGPSGQKAKLKQRPRALGQRETAPVGNVPSDAGRNTWRGVFDR